MIAVMLAAGVGRRLYGDDNHEPPKALLEFAGQTLLARHIHILRHLGISGLALVVGHRADEVLEEAGRAAPAGFVRSVFNPRYREGPVISLDTAGPFLTSGEDVLFMDADVLYPPEMLRRLVDAPADSFLYDRDFEAGEEPVKLCLAGGVPVDFGKQISLPHDEVGEWPGFMTMSSTIAAEIAAAARDFVSRDIVDINYEEAMRTVLHRHPSATFNAVDITGLPWIEIDFPEDLAHAREEVFPAVAAFEDAPETS